jgi:NAD(P)-dependent dehydrogenase (short-subunit alcohol dehydrogenase family)
MAVVQMAEIEPLGAITEAGLDRMFETNVKGTTFTVQRGRCR